MPSVTIKDGDTELVVEVRRENLWPIKHILEVFGHEGLVERKSTAYGDSWREFGPRGMVCHLARKFKRIRRELWDGEDFSWDNEDVKEVVDDCLVFFSRMNELLHENPGDLTGAEYLRAKEGRNLEAGNGKLRTDVYRGPGGREYTREDLIETEAKRS